LLLNKIRNEDKMECKTPEVIRLTKELVEIESTNIGTFEGEISVFVEKWIKKQTEIEARREEFLPGRFNVIAVLKGEQTHPNLVYIAHMDTVPAGNGWNGNPFKATMVNNRMYGRGTCDMKAGLAAAMIAFRDTVLYCKEHNIVPKYDFVFVASGDEEDVMRGADSIVKQGIATKESWVLDTEPTGALVDPRGDFPKGGYITMAHKGKTWFEITIRGRSAHGSMPYNGADAIIAMSEVVLEIRNALRQYSPDPVLGMPTACFGMIEGGYNINVVADECKVKIDMRLAPPLTNEDSIQLVKEAIERGVGRVPGTEGDYSVLAQRPYVEQNNESYLLKMLQESIKDTTGEYAEVVPFTGYTDSGVIDGSTGCANGMSYGARGANYHQANEYVQCDSVVENLCVIKKLAKKILL